MAGISQLSELSEAQLVADPEAFVANRNNFVIGFSDQVPLWAKATGRRSVFAQDEFHTAEDMKDF